MTVGWPCAGFFLLRIIDVRGHLKHVFLVTTVHCRLSIGVNVDFKDSNFKVRNCEVYSDLKKSKTRHRMTSAHVSFYSVSKYYDTVMYI